MDHQPTTENVRLILAAEIQDVEKKIAKYVAYELEEWKKKLGCEIENGVTKMVKTLVQNAMQEELGLARRDVDEMRKQLGAQRTSLEHRLRRVSTEEGAFRAALESRLRVLEEVLDGVVKGRGQGEQLMIGAGSLDPIIMQRLLQEYNDYMEEGNRLSEGWVKRANCLKNETGGRDGGSHEARERAEQEEFRAKVDAWMKEGEDIDHKDRMEMHKIHLAWEEYEGQWKSDRKNLTFATIRWPMLAKPYTVQDIYTSEDEIRAFLLSPFHSSDITHRKRVQNAFLRWHPDKNGFGIGMERVLEGERESVREGMTAVLSCLGGLQESLRSRIDHNADEDSVISEGYGPESA